MDEGQINDRDMLSISYLNALEYCPRRFYYECALSEFLDNAHVVEGIMARMGLVRSFEVERFCRCGRGV